MTSTTEPSARTVAPASGARVRPPLVRPSTVLLSGTSVALARHLGWGVSLTRLVFAGLTIAGGAGVLLYLWLWALVPVRPDDATPDAEVPDAREGTAPASTSGWSGFRTGRLGAGAVHVRRTVPVALLLLVVCGVAALVGFVLAVDDGSPLPFIVPGPLESLLAGIACVAWVLAVDRHDPSRGDGTVIRRVAGAVLVVAGAVLVLLRPGAGTVVVAVLMVLAGAGVLAAPRILTLWRELIGERAAREREEQRAEIAAHLHDSVLQTLALIQRRVEPGSEVARLARAQERELRDWLFAGTDPFAGDLATELRDLATALELEHVVRFDVVTVGIGDDVPAQPLLGAAREAMTNAARHAGGDVSVYVEATPERVDLFVRDRGAGFDPDAIPDGRFGIRESIVGRMQRAGGSAEVRSSESGTEVRLAVPREAMQQEEGTR